MLVALTGNYGSGKSYVLGLFEELGAQTVDADLVVKGLLGTPEVMEKVVALLGESVLSKDGGLIKERVAELVFADERLRRLLEDIIHPLVFDEVERVVSEHEGGFVVVEATVIFERGYEGRFDRTIAIVTDEETLLRRLMADGVSRMDALRRLNAQMPAAEKAARADHVIDNSGPRDETRTQAELIYEELTG